MNTVRWLSFSNPSLHVTCNQIGVNKTVASCRSSWNPDINLHPVYVLGNPPNWMRGWGGLTCGSKLWEHVGSSKTQAGCVMEPPATVISWGSPLLIVYLHRCVFISVPCPWAPDNCTHSLLPACMLAPLKMLYLSCSFWRSWTLVVSNTH